MRRNLTPTIICKAIREVIREANRDAVRLATCVNTDYDTCHSTGSVVYEAIQDPISGDARDAVVAGCLQLERQNYETR